MTSISESYLQPSSLERRVDESSFCDDVLQVTSSIMLSVERYYVNSIVPVDNGNGMSPGQELVENGILLE